MKKLLTAVLLLALAAPATAGVPTAQTSERLTCLKSGKRHAAFAALTFPDRARPEQITLRRRGRNIDPNEDGYAFVRDWVVNGLADERRHVTRVFLTAYRVSGHRGRICLRVRWRH